MRTFLALGLLVGGCLNSGAKEPVVVELQLNPQSVNQDAMALRLLPAAPELKHGNAAVVMLRSIWERQAFWHHEWPQLRELMELPYDDPRIIDEFSFGMQPMLRRAAYIRDADWNYPLDEELHQILLPDAQGLQSIAGRGLSLWIGQQLAKGDFGEAREGLLTQLACARHVGRTPFRVTHLTAYAIADLSLDKTEILIQQPKSANLYWALARLPDALGDTQAMLQWEAEMMPRSLPSLVPKVPPLGDAAWKKATEEFTGFMQMQEKEPLTEPNGERLREQRLAVARQEISQHFSEAQLAEMSEEEVVMRWILDTNDQLYTRIETAFKLPSPQAIAELQEVEKTSQEMLERTGVPASPFPEDSVETYLNLHRFSRRVKFLQTVEAIRDHAAQNDGELPETLGDVALHVPNDPLTAEPFHYTLTGDQATLEMPVLDGVDPSIQERRVYEISVAQ